MSQLRRVCAFFAIVVTVALTVDVCDARAQDPWPYIARTQALKGPPNVSMEVMATVMGLPLFTEHSLPAGYREYRFQVECGLCLPMYLIRLRISPGGKIIGNAYLLWFADDSTLFRDTTTRRRATTPPNNCASPLRPSAAGPQFDYTWCEARLAKGLKWTRLFARMDSLGIIALPTAAGYAPEPPNFGVDTVKLRDRTVFAPRHDCGDIGSESLAIAALIGAEYRAAYVWCLESKAPGKPEHSRVAKAYQLLSNVVVSYKDTTR